MNRTHLWVVRTHSYFGHVQALDPLIPFWWFEKNYPCCWRIFAATWINGSLMFFISVRCSHVYNIILYIYYIEASWPVERGWNQAVAANFRAPMVELEMEIGQHHMTEGFPVPFGHQGVDPSVEAPPSSRCQPIMDPLQLPREPPLDKWPGWNTPGHPKEQPLVHSSTSRYSWTSEWGNDFQFTNS